MRRAWPYAVLSGKGDNQTVRASDVWLPGAHVWPLFQWFIVADNAIHIVINRVITGEIRREINDQSENEKSRKQPYMMHTW